MYGVEMRTLDDIRILLHKFYAGETSSEEEAELADFFSASDDLPEDMLADKRLFATLAEMSNAEDVPEWLEERISSAIDRECSQSRHLRVKKFKRLLTGAAAVLIVAFGVTLLLRNETPKLRHGEITDSTVAYKTTEKTLLYISEKMNKAEASFQRANMILKNLENSQNKQ